MALVDRVKNIIVSPRTEWPRIAEEPATVGSLYTGYILILAAIGPIATLLHLLFVGLGFGVGIAIAVYLISLVVTYVLALIVDSLAPTFGGEKNFVQSLKLTAYSWTATWVAGILSLLGPLAILALVVMVYSFYTFYLGVPVMKKVATEKAIGFTLIVVVCGVVLGVVLNRLIVGMIVGSAVMGPMGMIR